MRRNVADFGRIDFVKRVWRSVGVGIAGDLETMLRSD